MSGALTFRLSRPDAETLRLDVSDGQRMVIRAADCHVPGRTPRQLTDAFYAVAQRHLILSRPAVVTAGWSYPRHTGGPLWAQLRAAIAAMPRERAEP